jgi:hypothetical protein
MRNFSLFMKIFKTDGKALPKVAKATCLKYRWISLQGH